jgi:uncharacterized protein (UPF0276 family)
VSTSGAAPSPRRAPSGVGLGLRWEFLEEVLEGPAVDVDFFEVSPENYMRRGGYFPQALERIRSRYPLVTHGLTLSLGATYAPGDDFVSALRAELDRVDTPWHSDHLAFTSAGALALHELLPLRFSRDAAWRIADRLENLREKLGRPLAVENVTYYAPLGRPELSEADFLNELFARTQAPLLLDVNNVYVNATNHGFDAWSMISALPLERVIEIHVAGHAKKGDLVLDTHGAPVPAPVLELLERTLERTGPVPVLLERDKNVPPLAELLAEVAAVRAIWSRAVRRSAPSAEERRAASA